MQRAGAGAQRSREVGARNGVLTSKPLYMLIRTFHPAAYCTSTIKKTTKK